MKFLKFPPSCIHSSERKFFLFYNSMSTGTKSPLKEFNWNIRVATNSHKKKDLPRNIKIDKGKDIKINRKKRQNESLLNVSHIIGRCHFRQANSILCHLGHKQLEKCHRRLTIAQFSRCHYGQYPTRSSCHYGQMSSQVSTILHINLTFLIEH